MVNSHFAAHMEKVTSRNSDFEYCYNQMAFGPKPSNVSFGGGGMQQNFFGDLDITACSRFSFGLSVFQYLVHVARCASLYLHLFRQNASWSSNFDLCG